MRAYATLLVSLIITVALGGCQDERSNGTPTVTAADLKSVFTSDTIWNGVATKNGRVFVCFPHNDGSAGTRIGEVLASGQVVPYPTSAWNNWTPGGDAKQKFVRTNSIRFGPDGNLWTIDTGTPKADGAVVADGPKLVAIDIKTNQVVRIISLGALVREKSFVDDLRFNGPAIYVTDAGVGAIIVLDNSTGQGRRVLENDTSTTQRRPLMGEGKILYKPTGELATLNADQMEVSPDGKYFYFQPASGPLHRIETRFLNDASLSATALASKVELVTDTPTSGGTAMDADGNIYYNDANAKRLLKLTPDGQITTLLADPRLIWGDAMWIDDDGSLWIPAPQMNRTPEFQRGVSTVDFPVHLYRLTIKLRPLRS